GLGQVDAEKVGLAQLLDHGPRELLGLVVVLAHRLELLLAQEVGQRDDVILLLGQIVVHLVFSLTPCRRARRTLPARAAPPLARPLSWSCPCPARGPGL